MVRYSEKLIKAGLYYICLHRDVYTNPGTSKDPGSLHTLHIFLILCVMVCKRIVLLHILTLFKLNINYKC